MPEQHLLIGKISGVFGIKGWVKVFSYTEDRENILDYSPWVLQKGEQSKAVNVITGRTQGKAIVACLEGVNNRDDAELLTGWEVFIKTSQLPPTELIPLKPSKFVRFAFPPLYLLPIPIVPVA